MNDDTRVRDFLDRMANEIEVAPVDWRPPVRRARRRRTVAMLLVAVAVVMIIPAVSLGISGLIRTESDPSIPATPTEDDISIEGQVIGDGVYPAYTVDALPGWSTDGTFVTNDRSSGVLGLNVWDVGRVAENPCHWLGRLFDPGPTVGDLAAALEAQTLRNATVPTAVQLDGHVGKFLEWSVPEDMVVHGDANFQGCDVFPGNGHRDFVSWFAHGSTQNDRYQQVPGQVDKLWILDVDGQRLVVDATYSPATQRTEREQLDRVVNSIHFVGTNE